MSTEEEIKKMLNLIQISLHDQVNALKSDTQRAVGDSETALEISATLEKTINELTSEKLQTRKLVESQGHVLQLIHREITENNLRIKKIKILTGMSHLCWHLSMRILTMAITHQENEQSQLYYFEQLFDLITISRDFYTKVNEAKTVEEANMVGEELADRYYAIQKQTFTKE